MIEMKYTSEHYVKILDKGSYKGFDYAVVSYGTHPCSYIFIPKNHNYYGKSYDEIELDCHDGLTFSQEDLIFNPMVTDNWVIGWDYRHYTDYDGIYEAEFMKEFKKYHKDLKKWTTKELIKEVKKVIEQL